VSKKMKLEENENLTSVVEADTGLKQLVVNYIGESLGGTKEDITVEMIVEVFAVEFPEFLMTIAEENFFRGYEQALVDVESSEKTS
tara:strand:+ start:166 stop:423 length:258 start_codon:yes stop_codon:yes gene_type:complete